MPKPKRAKELIPKTAMQCKVEGELVGDVVNHYYTNLRKKLESLEDPIVGVPVLGTFKARRSKLDKSVKFLTDLLSGKRPESFDKIEKYNLDIKLRDKQQSLIDKIDEIENEKLQRKNDLGKQERNS